MMDPISFPSLPMRHLTAALGLVSALALPLQAFAKLPVDFRWNPEQDFSAQEEPAGPTVTPTIAFSEFDFSATSVTRGEFIHALISHLYEQAAIETCFSMIVAVPPATFELLFTDVGTDDSLSPFLCTAMKNGLVRGYADGTFRPNARITVGEAAKILAVTGGLHKPDADLRGAWFTPYFHELKAVGVDFGTNPNATLTGPMLKDAFCKIWGAESSLTTGQNCTQD